MPAEARESATKQMVQDADEQGFDTINTHYYNVIQPAYVPLVLIHSDTNQYISIHTLSLSNISIFAP